ncbi:MAG: PASTA domain-containing protein [Flavobacteriaceae bacterium]|nr:PASTA domain-containing protein [Flavobacteriaceae bacterium]
MNFIKFLYSKTFLINLAVAIVVIGATLFATMKYLEVSTRHGEKIEVPDLSKLSVSEAETVLADLSLRVSVMDSASFNPNYPPLSVVEQKPKAGEDVKENRKIYLTLNPSKYQNIAIPNILGKTKRQALSELQATGFNIGEFIYVRDIGLDVVRGVIYEGKEVKIGQKLPKYAVLDLKLGDGNGR